MKNIKKVFPTKLPYITEKSTFIPEDMLFPDGLIGNDIMYLIIYHSDKKRSDKDAVYRLMQSCKKSRTSEWRRRIRLQKLGLI